MTQPLHGTITAVQTRPPLSCGEILLGLDVTTVVAQNAGTVTTLWHGTCVKGSRQLPTVTPPPVSPTLSGHVVAINGSSIIINIGSANGVETGMLFDLVHVKQLIDPVSHQVLTVKEKMGKMQIDAVSANAAVGHSVSGKAAVRIAVISEGVP